ncbi:OmpA family protein [Croceibacterium sp. TMG7-5b_MA50]|uniref:OmpA family protein n=1 Tax=Croceibacterium sp. TMG7-5b_MA50 TaxID=3121290 RepID=UPI00322215BE
MKVTLRQGGMALAGVVALLAGCRDTGVQEQPEAAASEPPVIAVPTATASSSIIRPEVVSEPVVDAPPEPVRLTIRFPEGSRLPADAAGPLAAMLKSEALAAGWPILVTGHSDSDGTDQANLATSRRRAEAVAGWLVEQGVDAARIRVVALGEQNPAAPNARPDGTPDEAGRARNRRVELVIAPPEGSDAATAEEQAPSAMEQLADD